MKNKSVKIYQQVIDQIKGQVFTSGDHLPSTREAAKLYRCHRFTVMQAYQNLVAEGWIEVTTRSRYRVSEKIPIVDSKSKPTKSGTRTQKALLSKLLNPTPTINLERDRYSIEFWGGQPDLNLFPQDEFARVLSAAVRRSSSDDFGYGLVDGLPNCLKATSNYLRKSRALINREWIMTNGSQEALLICAQALSKPGDTIAVEAKGYPPAWRLFESLGLNILPIPVDEEGLNVGALKSLMKRTPVKFVYVTPLHQYPTTVTLSPRRRQQLIQLAEVNGMPIIEDDYDNEFHYTQQPPPPLSTETDLGIYVCSFSKVIFPGLRLGAIGCHPIIKERLSYQKYLVSRQTDFLSQVALSAWIKDGGFERHLRKMRRVYERRFAFMKEKLASIQKHYPISWCDPNGGMSIWVNLNKDSRAVAEKAKLRGIFFQTETTMTFDQTKGTHLRIGFAGVTEAQIEQGLNVLQTILLD
jgi:GntR family transcriptional regulator/MocR family aminotransferase